MADRNDFDDIMHSIKAGLTGEPEIDIEYLKGQIERYKDHELNKEIIRACARLMYDLLPAETVEELSKAIDQDSLGVDTTLEQVQYDIYKKNYDKALSTIESLVKKVEDLNAFQDDSVSEYHNFDEPFEEILYDYRTNPEKDLRPAQIPYAMIYALYGSLLVEFKRFLEAREDLLKGLRWNPMSFSLRSEYIETFKMTGDLEQFRTLTTEAFKNVFRPGPLARCYRNLGYYFVEKKLWPEATACYMLSLQYDNESQNAQSELYYISSATGAKIEPPTPAQLSKYSEQYGIPLAPDRDVLGLSYSYGKHFYEQGHKDMARYFLGICYDLARDEVVGEMLENLGGGDDDQ